MRRSRKRPRASSRRPKPKAAAASVAAATIQQERKMTQSGTVSLERLSPHIAKVTFSNPPANLIVPETVSRLHDMVVELSQDPDTKVVLFTSSLAEFFFNHFDLNHATDFPVLP